MIVQIPGNVLQGTELAYIQVFQTLLGILELWGQIGVGSHPVLSKYLR